MLYQVYDATEASRVLNMLSEGVRVGRPEATRVIVSPNWPSAHEHGAKVGDIISVDLAQGASTVHSLAPPIRLT